MARGPSHSLRLASYFVAPAAIEARLWKLSLTRQFGQWHDARLRDGATEGDESGQRTWSVERGRGGGQMIGAGRSRSLGSYLICQVSNSTGTGPRWDARRCMRRTDAAPPLRKWGG